MLLTSLALLVAAVVLVVLGAIEGSILLLSVALGCALGGAAALVAAHFLAPKMAAAAGALSEHDAARVGFSPMGVLQPAPSGNGSSGTSLAEWATADTPPIPGYEKMTAADVSRLVDTGSLGRPALAAMLAYEAGHDARKTVITKLERAVSSTSDR